MDFVAVLLCGFREACGGRGAAGDECNEAVYGGDVYGFGAACGFGVFVVRLDGERDGDLVCMACRVVDCDGAVAGFPFAAVCGGKRCL